jgi:hypothetical protein
MTIAADSIANRLRMDGRAHFYIARPASCPDGLECTDAMRAAAREAFAATAIATVVQQGQRWPTLCDNSDEIRLGVPSMDGGRATVEVISVHSMRFTNRQSARRHQLAFAKAGGVWRALSYESVDVEVEPIDAASAARCLWSPDQSMATGADPGGSTSGYAQATQLGATESCTLCRISTRVMLRLGDPSEAHLPPPHAAVFQGRDGGYLVQSAEPWRLIRYDSTGSLIATLGAMGQGRGAFQSIDLARLGAQGDTLYLLDNDLRRITVLSPANDFTRSIPLPWGLEQFWVLRDGRLLTLHTPRRGEDPVSIHTATGEIVRTFGGGALQERQSCFACAVPTATLAPSGYRIWLAWSDRYLIEEWDLSGRRISAIENRAVDFAGGERRTPGADADPGASGSQLSMPPPGLNQLRAMNDGSLWVSYTINTPLRGPLQMLDVIDPVRATLIKSFPDASLHGVISGNLRSRSRVGELGFTEIELFHFELDRSRCQLGGRLSTGC